MTDIREIINLHKQGMSERKIAERTGVTRHHVRKALSNGPNLAHNEGDSGEGINTYISSMSSALARSGRVSKDAIGRKDNLMGRVSMLMQDDGQIGEYKYEWMDSDLLRRRSASELIEIAKASSPEISRAIWDFHRACVPGWECRVIDPRTEGEHPQGQALIDAFRAKISQYHGGEEVLYTKMFTAILVRGSVLSEVYFEDDSRTPVDIAVPDPKTIRFREVDDPVRGRRWQVGQIQEDEFVPLEEETIRYVVLDPMPGKPYSQSPISSALFPAIFLMGIFQDLRRVIANQGWPRVDVEIDVEGIQEMLAEALNDDNVVENGDVIARVLASITSQVEDAISTLKPGDWYVHSSIVKVNDAVGTMDATALGEVTNVVEALERLAVKAVKTMPILQGISDAASEANANRQWEMWAAGIKALQHLVENSIQDHYNKVLQANGIVAKTVFRFSEIRAAEELRDAQTLMMKIDNAIKAEQAGYMEADEAAMYVTNHAIPDSIRDDRDPLLNTLISNKQEDMTQWADLDTDGGEGDNENENSRGVYRFARAGEMLPVVPESVTVTIVDAGDASLEFDEMIPAYAGILNAEVESTDGDTE